MTLLTKIWWGGLSKLLAGSWSYWPILISQLLVKKYQSHLRWNDWLVISRNSNLSFEFMNELLNYRFHSYPFCNANGKNRIGGRSMLLSCFIVELLCHYRSDSRTERHTDHLSDLMQQRWRQSILCNKSYQDDQL